MRNTFFRSKGSYPFCRNYPYTQKYPNNWEVVNGLVVTKKGNAYNTKLLYHNGNWTDAISRNNKTYRQLQVIMWWRDEDNI